MNSNDGAAAYEDAQSEWRPILGAPKWGRSNNCGGCGIRRVTVDDIRRWTGAKYTDEVYGPEFFEYDGVGA